MAGFSLQGYGSGYGQAEQKQKTKAQRILKLEGKTKSLKKKIAELEEQLGAQATRPASVVSPAFVERRRELRLARLAEDQAQEEKIRARRDLLRAVVEAREVKRDVATVQVLRTAAFQEGKEARASMWTFVPIMAGLAGIVGFVVLKREREGVEG